jgi:hypothetical protein
LEVQCHIFKCEQYHVRGTLRNRYLQELQSYLENTWTSRDAICVIISCASAYLVGYDAPDLHELVPDASPNLVAAYQDQEEIGWDQWFKGCLATLWHDMYVSSLCGVDHQIPHQTLERWAKHIISRTLEFVLQAWDIRNQIEHGTNDNPMATRKEKLIRKIVYQKERIGYFPNRYLEQITAESLQGLPIDNLVMTASQIEVLMRASKNNSEEPIPSDREDIE